LPYPCNKRAVAHERPNSFTVLDSLLLETDDEPKMVIRAQRKRDTLQDTFGFPEGLLDLPYPRRSLCAVALGVQRALYDKAVRCRMRYPRRGGLGQELSFSDGDVRGQIGEARAVILEEVKQEDAERFALREAGEVLPGAVQRVELRYVCKHEHEHDVAAVWNRREGWQS